MATFWGGFSPPGAAVIGDIWIRTNGNQERLTGAGWVQLQPGETRGDVVPLSGTIDQVLVKANSANHFSMKWEDPGPGLIWEDDFTNQDTWPCFHGLRNKFVSVLVVKTDGTVMIPEIDYAGATINDITLRFAENVSGTVIIRR